MPQADSTARVWGIVAGAGRGRRMGGAHPKQYLRLCGKSIAEHTLGRLLALPELRAIVVSIDPQDRHWRRLRIAHHPALRTAPGGQQRSASVRQALRTLEGEAQEQDWVLIHDLVRPCVRSQDIARLLSACRRHPVGGILARPLDDTIKQCAASSASGKAPATPSILRTLDRRRLWRAQTPQLFRYGVLRRALEQCAARDTALGDEAQALEACNAFPLLVEGAPDNIKITRPEDLPLAAFLLRQQQRAAPAEAARGRRKIRRQAA